MTSYELICGIVHDLTHFDWTEKELIEVIEVVAKLVDKKR